MVCAVLAILSHQQPTYKVVESFSQDNETLIGSPKGETFYIEKRKSFYNPY